jgi:hypothetical protein
MGWIKSTIVVFIHTAQLSLDKDLKSLTYNAFSHSFLVQYQYLHERDGFWPE